MNNLTYLTGYPTHLHDQVQQLIDDQKLGTYLLKRYPTVHQINNDRAVYEYCQALKNTYLKKSPPLSKVVFDQSIQVMKHALGQHTSVSRVHGKKLKNKREIRIASVFKNTPEAFLKMIVVHELAHIKEMNHNKAFYQLCTHMEPEYHQLEFDLRLYLLHLDYFGELYPADSFQQD
ncbi:UTP pyrophosphatase [BD1-7 clade bacterium]|uniref:UTP pyrophosphatase n=1 Tax=BD1-7 clade bacterium TaxID=2029982 RepID=A0A5S9PXU5_9GAMM|nr:UTP pyrophosphatase [BD1-7 clade bacterium]